MNFQGQYNSSVFGIGKYSNQITRTCISFLKSGVCVLDTCTAFLTAKKDGLKEKKKTFCRFVDNKNAQYLDADKLLGLQNTLYYWSI